MIHYKTPRARTFNAIQRVAFQYLMIAPKRNLQFRVSSNTTKAIKASKTVPTQRPSLHIPFRFKSP